MNLNQITTQEPGCSWKLPVFRRLPRRCPWLRQPRNEECGTYAQGTSGTIGRPSDDDPCSRGHLLGRSNVIAAHQSSLNPRCPRSLYRTHFNVPEAYLGEGTVKSGCCPGEARLRAYRRSSVHYLVFYGRCESRGHILVVGNVPGSRLRGQDEAGVFLAGGGPSRSRK